MINEEDDLIHSEDFHSDKGIISSFIIILIFLVWEIYIIYIFDKENMRVVDFLLYHMVTIILLFIWCVICNIRQQDMRISVLMFITITIFGAYGATICCIYIIMYGFYIKSSIPFAKWFESLFPDTKVAERDLLYDRIIFGLDDTTDHTNVEPFLDILEYGTLQQKQNAIAKISRYFQPKFAPPLLNALNSKESSIRIQAATCIANIEQKFLKKIISMEERLSDEPENIDFLIKYAQLTDNYAHSGILDPDRTENLRNKAIKSYEFIINKIKKGKNVRRELAKLYEKEGRLDDARKLYEECIEDNGIKDGELLLEYLEVLYELREYEVIHKIMELAFENASEIIKTYSKNYDLIETINMWNQGISEKQLSIGEAHYATK